jgi:hypothetical protein
MNMLRKCRDEQMIAVKDPFSVSLMSCIQTVISSKRYYTKLNSGIELPFICDIDFSKNRFTKAS